MSYAENIGNYLLRSVMGVIGRPRFGRFLHLENIKYKILQAVKRKESTFPDLVISYISTAFLFPKLVLENLRWDYVVLLFSLASAWSVPKAEINSTFIS